MSLRWKGLRESVCDDAREGDSLYGNFARSDLLPKPVAMDINMSKFRSEFIFRQGSYRLSVVALN